jgi:DNA polymerase-3 subunit epsilon
MDIETANAAPSSICQIACVGFEDGVAVDAWHSFVNPLEPFSALHTSLHRINTRSVENAPTFSELASALSARIANKVVASHMSFDRRSLQAAFTKHGLQDPQCIWLDTAFIARRAWPRFSRRGYGLKSVADWCGIAFSHHDALHDAMAAGQILTRASSHAGCALNDWLLIAEQTGVNETRAPAAGTRSTNYADPQ